MRNLLLVSFSYPPVERSGSRRPAALAKYLPRFGWDSIVLTPKYGGASRNSESVIETDYRDIVADWKVRLHLDGQRGLHESLRLPVSSRPGSDHPHTLLMHVAKRLLTYPDATKGWVPFATQAIEEIRRKRQRIDAILTTFPPVSCHLIGKRAKQILGCPWVADFRDLWTQDTTTTKARDLAFLQIPLEKSTLKNADALITVSVPWADRLRKRYPLVDICTIPNGFDPDEFRPRPPALTQKFTITHAGLLYEGRRDPTMLFEVLQELSQQRIICSDDVRVRFYGPMEPWLFSLVRRYGLEQVVELNGVIPRKQVIPCEMESQLLLLLSWTHPKEIGLHTGKLFEYLGAERPVVAIGGLPGVLTQVLKETNAGLHVSTKEELRQFLIRAYGEYKALGYVPYRGQRDAISQYNHLEMTRRVAEVLDRVVADPKAGQPEAARTLR
jgi:glycosyltransferase involved in cell wall biosynthesis